MIYSSLSSGLNIRYINLELIIRYINCINAIYRNFLNILQVKKVNKKLTENINYTQYIPSNCLNKSGDYC